MGAEGAAAINAHFWSLMGRLWSDFQHERHTASDKLREYTAKHKIHVNDVSQTVSTKNTPDWQLRSEAASLRRTVETLQAEIKQLKRARDEQAKAHEMARCAAEALKILQAEQLRRVEADAAEARTALAKEQKDHRSVFAILFEVRGQLARLKAQLEQSEALTLDLRGQLQTLEAHAQTLRAERAGVDALIGELEHALEVATTSATDYQRELLKLKQQHRQQQTPVNRLGAAA